MKPKIYNFFLLLLLASSTTAGFFFVTKNGETSNKEILLTKEYKSENVPNNITEEKKTRNKIIEKEVIELLQKKFAEMYARPEVKKLQMVLNTNKEKKVREKPAENEKVKSIWEIFDKNAGIIKHKKFKLVTNNGNFNIQLPSATKISDFKTNIANLSKENNAARREQLYEELERSVNDKVHKNELSALDAYLQINSELQINLGEKNEKSIYHKKIATTLKNSVRTYTAYENEKLYSILEVLNKLDPNLTFKKALKPFEYGKVKQVFLGGRYGCALRVDGIAYCWGGANSSTTRMDFSPLVFLGNSNYSSQEFRSNNTSPVLVNAYDENGKILRFEEIDRSDPLNCGITTQNKLYCWGFYNYRGAYGDEIAGSIWVEPTIFEDTINIDVGGLRFSKIVSTGCAVAMHENKNINGTVYCIKTDLLLHPNGQATKNLKQNANKNEGAEIKWKDIYGNHVNLASSYYTQIELNYYANSLTEKVLVGISEAGQAYVGLPPTVTLSKEEREKKQKNFDKGSEYCFEQYITTTTLGHGTTKQIQNWLLNYMGKNNINCFEGILIPIAIPASENSSNYQVPVKNTFDVPKNSRQYGRTADLTEENKICAFVEDEEIEEEKEFYCWLDEQWLQIKINQIYYKKAKFKNIEEEEEFTNKHPITFEGIKLNEKNLIFDFIKKFYKTTCGFTKIGQAYCWGPIEKARVGTYSDNPIPTKAKGKAPGKEIIGFPNNCGYTQDWRWYCLKIFNDSEGVDDAYSFEEYLFDWKSLKGKDKERKNTDIREIRTEYRQNFDSIVYRGSCVIMKDKRVFCMVANIDRGVIATDVVDVNNKPIYFQSVDDISDFDYFDLEAYAKGTAVDGKLYKWYFTKPAKIIPKK